MITISIKSSEKLKKEEDSLLTVSLIRNENNPNRPLSVFELKDNSENKVQITLNKTEVRSLYRGLRALSMEM